MTKITQNHWDQLKAALGGDLKRDVPLARYTAARVGGPADGLITVDSGERLETSAQLLWSLEVPFKIIGGGSNVLVSDAGYSGVVILNRARKIMVDEVTKTVWAESGASFGRLARKVSSLGFTGLEWAAGIPGTVGGAVFGNAGAHGGDVAGNLAMAEILHPVKGRQRWTPDQLAYAYRSSLLKREDLPSVILSARFRFEPSDPDHTKSLLDKFSSSRKGSQPMGASMGSMFKNPPGDFAGRLIEQAGLKGTRIGGAMISPIHANFFINDEECRAGDIFALVELARQAVAEQFEVDLELEIELIGDWEAQDG